MKYPKILFLLLAVFVFGCVRGKEEIPVKGEKPNRGIVSELKGNIVFQSDRDGDWEIFRIKASGKGLVKLTDNQAADEYPVFSPDGKQIAFKSNRSGKWQVYLMDAGGKNQVQLTKSNFDNYDPAWMPKAENIVFTSDRGEGERLYLINLETGKEEIFVEVNFRSGLSTFSPDGRYLLFTGNELGWNVYLVNLADKEVRRMTSRGGACRPDWSPDGKTIAYVSNRSDSIGDIWLMDARGKSQRRLTVTSELSDYYPAWSPDGSWIVYAASPNGKDGRWDLYFISADGSKRTRFTFDESRNKFPDWTD